MNILDEIVIAQKNGEARGITSICSANPSVLEAAILHARAHQSPILIESTCNQVNQYGGYIGMRPHEFVRYLGDLVDRLDFPNENLIIGGDHLGPEVWQAEPAESAMGKARVLVRDYVNAGYFKIHLDASMKLGDDPEGPLSSQIAAGRAADLARVVEDSYAQSGIGAAPRYVIGTEVPVPGGAREKESYVHVTRVTDTAETIESTRQAFYQKGLESAWERVIALVVQPGVEFGDDFILDYDQGAAAGLSGFIKGTDQVYEAHSTDYQTSDALHQMVADHFAILKVGPALTYAYREAIFALAIMEAVLVPEARCSNLIETLDYVMLADPTHWRRYYQGDRHQQRFARQFSYSDRSRYYWTTPAVQAALRRLFQNLSEYPIPTSLLSQYLPVQYARFRSGSLPLSPEAIIKDKIMDLLQDYHKATQP
jgi:D-tagatose-1,6-bisphosphate aldolase subunit GatZ/KbaZ